MTREEILASAARIAGLGEAGLHKCDINYIARLIAAMEPYVREAESEPTEPGIYAWASEGSYALVAVHKRPTEAIPEGGDLKGSVMRSTDFYNGCRIGGKEPNWGKGTWTRLNPPAPETKL